jgi:ATP-dependent DNA helicase RecQ
LSQVEGLVEEHPGATLDELIEAFAAASGRRVRPDQMVTTLHRLGARLIERGGRYWLAGAEEASPTPGEPPPGLRARVIVFDLETVVRQISTPPYLERHIYQIGAVRSGRDRAWADADERHWARWVSLPAIADPLLESAATRAKYEANREDPEAVLDAFLAYCTGATHLVAYNGTSLDFGVLDGLLAKHKRSLPGGIRKIDGLYLAQALWPVPPQRPPSQAAARTAQHRRGRVLLARRPRRRPDAHDPAECRAAPRGVMVRRVSSACALGGFWL